MNILPLILGLLISSSAFSQDLPQEKEPQFQNEYFKATVEFAGRSEKSLTISILLENIFDKTVKLYFPSNGATAIDNKGGTYRIVSLNGVAKCRYHRREFCSSEKEYSVFTPKSRHTLVFSFKGQGKGDKASFSADFFGYVDGEPSDMSIGISNIKIESQ
jgi:hypothetical protein